ncbi:hypothetical protein SO694_000114124 [Aureococcus anophagefferens]|uniref:DAGKc domain-containing protein n=1 Tax=Aureococcus anophagefferens TaxID=44056 RepID=A0ABR1GFE1_AURAN
MLRKLALVYGAVAAGRVASSRPRPAAAAAAAAADRTPARAIVLSRNFGVLYAATVLCASAGLTSASVYKVFATTAGHAATASCRQARAARPQAAREQAENRPRPPRWILDVEALPDAGDFGVVFVNPKSGGRQGRRALRALRRALHPCQVVDLDEGRARTTP